jgi:hypothetical protein
MAIIEQETALVRAGISSRPCGSSHARRGSLAFTLSDAARVKASSHYLNQQLPARCRELRRKHDELRAELRINLTVLATAHAVSEGIIRGVARELARKASPRTYGVSGRTSVPRPGAVQPVAISRVF